MAKNWISKLPPNIKLKPLFKKKKKLVFPTSKSIKILFITQFKYCQKLDFEASP